MAKSCQKTDIRHGTAAANNAQDTLESRLCCFLYFPITYRYAGTRMYPQVRPCQGGHVRTVLSALTIYLESIRNSQPAFWCPKLYSQQPSRVLYRPYVTKYHTLFLINNRTIHNSILCLLNKHSLCYSILVKLICEC